MRQRSASIGILNGAIGEASISDRLRPSLEQVPILASYAETLSLGVAALAEKPLFVPETMSLMTLLEQFKRTHLSVALVGDEFGGGEGLVSLADVIASIVGELPAEPGEKPMTVRHDDGSWLFDGGLDLDAVVRTLDAESILSNEDQQGS